MTVRRGRAYSPERRRAEPSQRTAVVLHLVTGWTQVMVPEVGVHAADGERAAPGHPPSATPVRQKAKPPDQLAVRVGPCFQIEEAPVAWVTAGVVGVREIGPVQS